MFTIVFTQAARAELIEAQDWYEGEAAGLGRRFRVAMGELLKRMLANPRQFPIVLSNVRRALVRRFPYAIFFVTGSDRRTSLHRPGTVANTQKGNV